jgi:DNA-binding NtrC family response regulator
MANTATATDTGQKKIILVQDDPYLFETRKAVLESNGYRVDLVHTVKEARRRSRELRCHLVIVDSEKDHDTALELCEEIKLNNPNVNVAVMTGYHVYLHSDCPDEVIRQEEGPAGFLYKVQKLLA